MEEERGREGGRGRAVCWYQSGTTLMCIQARERRAAQRKKLEEHTMRARKVCGVGPSGEEEKPRFIMKRCVSVTQ